MDPKIRQEFLERIQEYSLIDDSLMTVVFQDKACTQLLICRILQRNDLEVLEVSTQKELKNLWGRSVRLDILATDRAGAFYNIEVQRADKGASRKRARYNSSMLDSNFTMPGDEYDALPKTFVIFITENDYFSRGLPLYHIDRVVQETGELFSDDEHILYVNGQYRGDDPIGSLMHDFFCKDPNDMKNPVLAENVRYYKTDKEGVDHMYTITEEFVERARKEERAKAKKKQEEVRKAERKGKAKMIKAAMKNYHSSFEQACDMLEIPKEERLEFEKMLRTM